MAQRTSERSIVPPRVLAPPPPMWPPDNVATCPSKVRSAMILTLWVVHDISTLIVSPSTSKPAIDHIEVF